MHMQVEAQSACYAITQTCKTCIQCSGTGRLGWQPSTARQTGAARTWTGPNSCRQACPLGPPMSCRASSHLCAQVRVCAWVGRCVCARVHACIYAWVGGCVCALCCIALHCVALRCVRARVRVNACVHACTCALHVHVPLIHDGSGPLARQSPIGRGVTTPPPSTDASQYPSLCGSVHACVHAGGGRG